MPFKKGQKKKGGRKKGIKNKLSLTVKENFEQVFEKLGGFQGFYEWASTGKLTKEAFYKMYSKMLPSNMDIEHSGKLEHAIFMMPRPQKKKEDAK